MRRRRRRSRKTPWHFDDWDYRDYILERDVDSQSICSGQNIVTANNVNKAVLPRNTSFQIQISGNISLSLVGADGNRRELFRSVQTSLCGFHYYVFLLFILFFVFPPYHVNLQIW